MNPRNTASQPASEVATVEVEWTTLSYRTIAIYAVLACLLVLGILYSHFAGILRADGNASAGSSGRRSAARHRKPASRRRSTFREPGRHCTHQEGCFVHMDAGRLQHRAWKRGTSYRREATGWRASSLPMAPIIR